MGGSLIRVENDAEIITIVTIIRLQQSMCSLGYGRKQQCSQTQYASFQYLDKFFVIIT